MTTLLCIYATLCIYYVGHCNHAQLFVIYSVILHSLVCHSFLNGTTLISNLKNSTMSAMGFEPMSKRAFSIPSAAEPFLRPLLHQKAWQRWNSGHVSQLWIQVDDRPGLVTALLFRMSCQPCIELHFIHKALSLFGNAVFMYLNVNMCCLILSSFLYLQFPPSNYVTRLFARDIRAVNVNQQYVFTKPHGAPGLVNDFILN